MSQAGSGQDHNEQSLPDFESLCAATDEFLDQARRNVTILAPDLDPQLLNRQHPLHALALLSRSRHARVCVLLEDASPALHAGHGLIELAQQFPSTIELRLLAEEDQGQRSAWMVVDDTALIRRPDFTRLAEGHAHRHDPSLAPRLAREFNEWWQRARIDPNLRRLYL